MTQIAGAQARIAERFLLIPGASAAFGSEEVFISDLSVTGMRLRHPHPVEVGRKSVIQFLPDGSGTPVVLKGEVVWTQASYSLDAQEAYVSGVKTFGEQEEIERAIARFDTAGRLMRIDECRTTDRFLIRDGMQANFAHLGEISVCDISAKGARIESRQELRIGTRGTFQFAVPETSFEVCVAAEIVWSGVKAITMNGTRTYHAGLTIQEKPEYLRMAIGRFLELGKAAKDTQSLKLKIKIGRVRSRMDVPKETIDFSAPRMEEILRLVRAVRDELESNQSSAAEFYRKAFQIAREPSLRAMAGAIHGDHEALAVWEYLDRSIDPSIIALEFRS